MRIKLLIFFSFLCLLGFSQTYNNRWIVYDQKYYKFPVVHDGVYRITKTALVQAGFPFSELHPDNIQIFARGREIPIYLKNDPPAHLFDASDYIEFYAEKNTGWLDSSLYDIPQNQANPYYSLINDTINYYISFNHSTTNLRYQIETDTTFQSYTPQAYCIKHDHYNYVSAYSDLADGNPLYSAGEGYVDGSFYIDVPVSKSIPTTNIYSGGPSAAFTFSFSSISNAGSQTGMNHHVEVKLNTLVFDTSFSDRKVINKNITIPALSLQSSNLLSFSVINDLFLPSDINCLSYISVAYPHTFNFENSRLYNFIVPQGAKTLLQISNFNSGSALPVLYDLSSRKKIAILAASGNVFKALLPASSNSRNCIIAATSEIKNVTGIVSVTPSSKFTDYISNYKNADYIIVSHPLLTTEAENYQNYRNTTGYTTALLNINELYDQYAFGVNKHPAAIRGFIETAIGIWGSIPKNLLLIGKSTHAKFYRNDPNIYAITLVPSMGWPSSDGLFSAGLSDPGTFIPAIPTGRICAQSPEHVSLYLNKVKEYESNSPAEWMKNVLHFGGGYSYTEQTTFHSYLENYKAIIEDTLFGGKVTSFYKTSSLPIQQTQLQLIRDLINGGSSMLTFFGHASANTFDQSIEDPEAFSNQGKYPFLLANSCFVGDIHQVPNGNILPSMSEKWILIPNRGTIGFLASVGEGYTSYLNLFSTELYRQIAYKNYGKTLGYCINQTMRNNITQYSIDQHVTNTCLNMTLNGDPAVKMNSFAKPDLTVTPAAIAFDPMNVTTELNKFNVKILIKNIGRATSQGFLTRIKRTFPDNTFDIFDTVIIGCNYLKNLTVRFPVNLIKGVGINKITVTLDAQGTESYGSIDELIETNNEATVSFMVTSAEIIPVYPYQFAIYPNNTVTLKASTGYPFAPTESYIFEIDTTDAFNSPIKQTSPAIVQSGGIVSWTPSITLKDSTVYYWHVTKSGSANWKESSFIYIIDKTGWSQAHYFQFKNDYYKWIDYNKSARKFDFISTPQSLIAYNRGLAWGESQWLGVQFRINNGVLNNLGQMSSCGASRKIHIAVIDPVNVRCLPSNFGDFGQVNSSICSVDPSSVLMYPCDSANLSHIPSLINAVPNGYYIFAYSFISGNFASWPEIAKTAFDGLIDPTSDGNPRRIQNDRPWLFFCKKGDLNSAQFKVGATDYDTISLSVQMINNFYKGTISTDLIGPTHQWNELHWKSNSIDDTLTDNVALNVMGIKNSGDSVSLFTLPKDTTDIYNLNNRVDANLYPYLKLSLSNKDSINHTPSQLKKLQITHEGIPETAVNPQKGYLFYRDTVNQGDNITFSVAFENVSPFDMDSLLIKYWVLDKNNAIHIVKLKKLRKHPHGDILRDTVRFSTSNFVGLNSIWVEANPINATTGTYDQLEEYHFNNIAQKKFYVKSDKSNPMLDITFDGVHILEGDIVSAKPEIMIQLKDENKYLALNDSSLFAIYLKSLSSGIENRVYFTSAGRENMKFIPAQLPKNSCKILYNPAFTVDGKYQLRVMGKDKSGNESGDNDYKITFEVITKSTITELFNYPNPFSTSTKFVFTLTGSELPTDFRIQIVTVSGKLCKTITLAELGNIHIGRNITEYTWDGKDDFGDKLANGVYFYHVITSINGQSIEKRTTEADKYFTHGFGKLYIMR